MTTLLVCDSKEEIIGNFWLAVQLRIELPKSSMLLVYLPGFCVSHVNIYFTIAF